MRENPRIEELRRRVQKDPSSIAFAQLGEEYRRAGDFEEAVKTCRTGLARHPGYLSARVTLGRALIEVGDLDAAETELNQVLRVAPENLAAIRGMAEIHHRRGELPEALTSYRRALTLAQNDPDLEQAVDDIERVIESGSGSGEMPGGQSPDKDSDDLMAAAPTLTDRAADDVAALGSGDVQRAAQVGYAPIPEREVLPALEAFLDAIVAYRERASSLS